MQNHTLQLFHVGDRGMPSSFICNHLRRAQTTRKHSVSIDTVFFTWTMSIV